MSKLLRYMAHIAIQLKSFLLQLHCRLFSVPIGSCHTPNKNSIKCVFTTAAAQLIIGAHTHTHTPINIVYVCGKFA